jgi:hypothetical protein
MRLHPLLIVFGLSGLLVSGCGSATNKATGARSAKPLVLTLANPNAGDAGDEPRRLASPDTGAA